MPLSATEEDALIQRLKTHPTGQDRALLITSNLRFVVTIANRYKQSGIPLEDLINEGNIGLIEAVQRFDPDRGTRFITYAVWWIRKSILAAIANGSLIRVPQYQQRKLKRVRNEEKSLASRSSAGSRTKDPGEPLADAGDRLEELLASIPREFPLSDVYGWPSGPGSEGRVDDRPPSPELRMIEEENEQICEEILGQLQPLERKIIRGRFGMEDGRPRLLRELADEVGLSRERVRQIEMDARSRMRRAIRRRRI